MKSSTLSVSVSRSLSRNRVWVAGHAGMVGGSLCRRLAALDCDVLTVDRKDLDLRDQGGVRAWLKDHKPDVIFLAAAKVGGIFSNSTRPAEFMYDNLAINTNVIHGAHEADVQKLLFLASNCMYPRSAQQPITEESLLTGELEPTNEGFALAKIAAVKLCQTYRRQYGRDYICAVPANVYGPGDNFDPQQAHVPAALIFRLHMAKKMNADTSAIWGTGKPLRDFLFIDDLTDGLVYLMERYSDEMPINVSTGKETSIRQFAETVARVVGWDGTLEYDTSKPDGMMKKILDPSKMAKLGWSAQVDLEVGLRRTYAWFLDNEQRLLNG